MTAAEVVSFRIESEDSGHRKLWRAVCLDCGWESFWRGSTRFATGAGDTHAAKWCPGPRETGYCDSFECDRCGVKLGLTGPGSGSDDDIAAEVFYDSEIEYHQSGQCTPTVEEVVEAEVMCGRGCDGKTETDACDCTDLRPVHLGVFVHDSPEWHAARATRLGGSEVSALFGLSPWESEFSLYHRKAGTALPERVNDEMRAGTLLEPVIVAKFAAEHPEMLVQPRAGTWVHPERDWQLANPDALVSYRDEAGRTCGGILETKFALQTYGWGEPGTDDIPPYYLTQVQWYLDVMGLAVCWLMVFIGGCAEWRTYVIRADAVRQAELRAAGVEFMARVARREAPPIDGHDATYEVVREMHPDIDSETVELSGEAARAFCVAKHVEAAAKVEARKQTALLAEVMGSAQRARYAGRSIARRQAKGGGTPYVVAERGLPFGEILEATA